MEAIYQVNCFSTANPGLILNFIDEKSSTVPTAAAVNERALERYSASDVVKSHRLRWLAKDITDLTYNAVATATNPCYFKLYTDNANFGSSVVATPYITSFVKYRFQFRGLKTV